MDNAIEILHTLDIPIFRISGDGHTHFLNITCADLYHADPVKIEGRHFSEWLDASSAKELNSFLGTISNEHQKHTCQVGILKGTQDPIFIQWTFAAFYDYTDTLQFIQIHGNEVTDLVERERLVQLHAQQFKWTFDNSPVPLWREDFSGVLDLIEGLRTEGITDFDQYLKDNPDVVLKALQLVKILDVNHATVKSFGFESKEDMLGRLSETFHEQILETFRLEMVAIANGDETFAMESPAMLSNGKLVSTLIFMNFPKQRELFKEIIIAHIDITELKDTQRALETAKTEAEAANQAKSTFVSNISHEIRTPLNGIIGFTRLLNQEDLTEKQSDFVHTIKGCCDTLLALINQVLDLSKIQAVKLEVKDEPFRPEELLSEITKVQALAAKEKGLQLQLDIDGSLPHIVRSDRLKVNQVLSNLVRNSVKFCDEGFIKISAMLSDSDICISVIDTGIGISPKALKSIFNPFIQEDDSNSRIHSGTGLGLTIARELARTLGGDLKIQSEKGIGTECVFTFPYKKVDPSEIDQLDKPRLPEKPQTNIRRLRVLIADDNRLNIKLLQHVLHPYKLRISSCLNGKEALEHLSSEPCDAVFMDLQMPELDGYGAIEAIRNGEVGEELKDIPISVVSANVLSGEIERVKSMGVQHFVPKPIDPEIVRDFLEFASKS